jgi:HD-GYP domain-containing protein (c-di-GMP phosphodiesterase class II)
MRGNVDQPLAIAQALRYAEELRELYGAERLQRRRAEHSLTRLEDSYRTTVRALATALDLRDDMTGGHAERVTRLAVRLTERLAPNLCSDPQLEFGFLLHDVGKIGVPDAILLKPAALDEAERREIERHPLHGEKIVTQIPYLHGLTRQIVVSHHERWDGEGYPHGLFGSGIPLAARIFSVADTFDAMTNDRPYRDALPVSSAVEEIERQSGRQFDPAVVHEFASLVLEEAA